MSAVQKINPAGFLTYTEVLKAIKQEFPDFKIVSKSESRLMKVIDFLLKVITFWRMSSFMQNFATTLGTTVYTGTMWETRPYTARAATLRHEAVHMRQFKRLGFLPFAITYLFLPIPVLFAAGRRNLEMEAYEETLRAYAEYHGLSTIRQPAVQKFIVDQFTSSSYFWMWPCKWGVNDWYEKTVRRLEEERESGKAR